MKLDTKIMDILFRRISPGVLFRRLQSEDPRFDAGEDRELFVRYSGVNMGEYSLDEREMIYRRLKSDVNALVSRQKWRPYGAQPSAARQEALTLPSLAIYSVLNLSERLLKQLGQEPLCRIEQVLSWRELYLMMGQDLFVCAFLAHEDIQEHFDNRRNFAWPAVIRTDHAGLNALLKRGVAENHQHLYGSSQTFALSWCSVMNYPESHLEIDERFEQLFQPFVTVGAEERFLTTQERVRYACLCRKHLFTWLHMLGEGQAAEDRSESGPWDDASGRDWEWVHGFHPELRAAYEIGALRAVFGAKVPQPGGGEACLDYALENDIFQAAPHACYRSMAGERYLLYRCFRAFFQGEMDERMKLLFYLYIMLKALFRSELIQVNKQLGFRNFSNYQDRKDLLCGKECYQAELIRMGINAPLREGRVTSLETRITPCSTARDYLRRVREIDGRYRSVLQEVKSDCFREVLRADTDKSYMPEEPPFFYVIHFIKRPDVDSGSFNLRDLLCRHHKLREKVRMQAIALSEALSGDSVFRSRIRGIDCASFEIGCPPEVFAMTFRYLRRYRDYSAANHPLLLYDAPRISATYHAGEDFLDIAGALRTIDEAVTLLEFQRGDRIGHALGLGVDPEMHYELKAWQVFMPKQDRLDDLVWLLYRSRELGVHMDPHLYGRLKKEAETLFLEIYGSATAENHWHVGLMEYYCCMKLRADDPSLYKFLPTEGSEQDREAELCRILSPYDMFRHSTFDPALEQYRQSAAIAGMCHYYHFGTREKVKGREICVVDVDRDYMELMRKTQNALQEELADRGIIIECNPSSNVLIGTFGKYHRHPIFRFNNASLELNHDRYRTCSQLQVCVNTDDLGVFDTSQEFEYALLYDALSELRDQDGLRKYREAEILNYLESLRGMGILAVFPRKGNDEGEGMRQGSDYV